MGGGIYFVYLIEISEPAELKSYEKICIFVTSELVQRERTFKQSFNKIYFILTIYTHPRGGSDPMNFCYPSHFVKYKLIIIIFYLYRLMKIRFSVFTRPIVREIGSSVVCHIKSKRR